MTIIFINSIFNRLNTHRELYDALKQVTSNGDIQVTSDIDNHVAKLFLFDFEQCGIHLPEKQRIKVVELNNYILQVSIIYLMISLIIILNIFISYFQVGQRFMAGAVTPRTVNANALPDVIRQ